jgi:hypothetical protein
MENIMPEQQNESELLFEQYLTERGLRFEHQPNVPGKSKKLDYRVVLEESWIFFEVKEFRGGILPLERGVYGPTAYDPYERIYTKLEEAWEQLNQYNEYSCSVVLYNDSSAPVILKPHIVLGAMLGTVSYTVDEDSKKARPFFSVEDTHGYRTGFVIDYEFRVPRYTPLSSIIVIEKVPLGEIKFSELCDERDKHREKNGTAVENSVDTYEYLQSLIASGFDLTEAVIRVLVYENPFATIPLPRNLFTGPYDQRWGMTVSDPKNIAPIFTGQLFQELTATEAYRNFKKLPLAAAGLLKEE